jgi:ABC-type Fe3+/spermidine/putrescine transport system ATPase subunit
LTIVTGIHTALLGRSGSGKSTVLRILAGLEAPVRGNVLIDGRIASGPDRIVVPPHRRHVGMVFQDLGLWPTMTVVDNVLMALFSSADGRGRRHERAMDALRICRIEHLADRRPGSVSGGEQQRAALARAIVASPRFLLLDEPFAGLDLCTKSDLLADVSELAMTRGITIVLVTHDPAEALSLCSRAVLLEGGIVRADGPWGTVLAEPRSDVLKAFSASIARH